MCSTWSPARVRPGQPWWVTPALTRSPSPDPPGREDHPAHSWPGTRQEAHRWNSGGKAAHVIFEDAPIDQAIEGVINGIFFNQGHVCCAGSRLFVQESDPRLVRGQAQERAYPRSASEIRSTRTPTSAPSTSRSSWTRSTSSSMPACRRALRSYQPACDLPTRGYWFVPTFFTGVRRVAPHRPGGDLRAGAVDHDVSARQKRRWRRPTTPPTACRPESGPPKAPASCGWPTRCSAGVVWANTYNKFDPASPFGGYKESGFGREGGRHGLLNYLKGIH